MRDFPPRAAAARRRIAEALLAVFERWGYARVITPAFEYEDVLALGLGRSARDATVRFVEPSSGRVVGLRPDITPQIARLVATRFADEPGPLRFAYEGTVVRLERGARSQRELIQTGVELLGVSAPHGDAEVIALAVEALAAAGLAHPTISLAHLGIAREVFSSLGLEEGADEAVRDRIAKRDAEGLAEALREAKGPVAVRRFIEQLPSFSGGPSLLENARKIAPTPAIRKAIDDLRELVAILEELAVPAHLHVDLAEIRGFDYYTGVRFQGFVPGVASPVVQGGRYDDLLARYGGGRPAVGFAVDVEAAAGALETAATGESPAAPFRLELEGTLVVGAPLAAAREAARLRAAGERAAVAPPELGADEAVRFAARWGFREIRKARG